VHLRLGVMLYYYYYSHYYDYYTAREKVMNIKKSGLWFVMRRMCVV